MAAVSLESAKGINWYLTAVELNTADGYIRPMLAHESDKGGRGISLDLTCGEEAINLQDYNVTLEWCCGKKFGEEPFGYVYGGHLVVAYPRAMLTAGTMATARISVKKKDGTFVTGSRNFRIEIQPSPISDEVVSGSEEYSVLAKIIADAEETIGNAQTLVEALQDAGGRAIHAADEAQTAADVANSAATRAESAADEATDVANDGRPVVDAAREAGNSAKEAANKANKATSDAQKLISDLTTTKNEFEPWYEQLKEDTTTVIINATLAAQDANNAAAAATEAAKKANDAAENAGGGGSADNGGDYTPLSNISLSCPTRNGAQNWIGHLNIKYNEKYLDSEFAICVNASASLSGNMVDEIGGYVQLGYIGGYPDFYTPLYDKLTQDITVISYGSYATSTGGFHPVKLGLRKVQSAPNTSQKWLEVGLYPLVPNSITVNSGSIEDANLSKFEFIGREKVEL